MSLEEARTRMLLEAAERARGTTCPCCLRPVRAYRRTLTKPMAVALVELHEHTLKHPAEPVVHLATFLWNLRSPGARGGDAMKLAYWGLIERLAAEDAPPQLPRTGTVRITGLGRRFAAGRQRVPSYILEQPDGTLRVPDDAPLVSIEDALGSYDQERVRRCVR
jgi:hypothetical protein